MDRRISKQTDMIGAFHCTKIMRSSAETFGAEMREGIAGRGLFLEE
jgi:hypothetical protein